MLAKASEILIVPVLLAMLAGCATPPPPESHPVWPSAAAPQRIVHRQNIERARDLVSPGLEIPTQWEKATYDSLSQVVGQLRAKQQARIHQLSQENIASDSIQTVQKQFDAQIDSARQRVKQFISQHPLRGKVGAFEGAGYRSNGLFRPTLNSIMHQFTREDKYFYPVNERAIIRVIEYYSE